MAVHNAREIAVALRAHGEDVRQSVAARLSRIAQEAVRDMRRRAPKFQSELTNGIKATYVAQTHYRIDVGVEYGAAVDQGRKPGKGLPYLGTPASEGALGWLRGRRADYLRTFVGPVTKAMRRGLALNPKKGSKLANEREADLRTRYFALSRSVKRKGIKAQPFFTPVVDELQRTMPQLLAETVQAAVARANAGTAGANRAGGAA